MGMVIEKEDGGMPPLNGWLQKKHKSSSFGGSHSKRYIKCNDEKGARPPRAARAREPRPPRSQQRARSAARARVLAQAGCLWPRVAATGLRPTLG